MKTLGKLVALTLVLIAQTGTIASPLIQSINPSQGPIAGGTQVTLTGTGFTGTMLTLDGTDIVPTSASDTQIVFQTPARDNGIATIQLRGNGPNAYAEFLYLPPSLQSLPPGYITTVMGIGKFRGDGRLATSAMVDAGLPGYAIAGDGSLFYTEPNEHVIRHVRTDGIIERYAGTGRSGYSGDGGPALNAQLSKPRGIAIDPKGNLLVSESEIDAHCIRRIDSATGVITTLYGGKTAGYAGDGGPATSAQFYDPVQIAFDGLGNLYVLEFRGVRIRKIDPSGTITTLAGTGTAGYSGDGGPATQATFNIGTNDFGGLAADSTGNVYLADSFNGRVRKIDGATGIITTFLANTGRVTAVHVDRHDNLYVGVNTYDATSARILKLSSSGQLLQSWGKGKGLSEDGTVVTNAPLCLFSWIALDHSDNILFGDSCSNRIRRINATTGVLDTIAGMGPQIIGDAGPALATVLAIPGPDLLFLPGGDLLTAEGGNFRIRRMDSQGNLSTVAGNGFMGLGGTDNVPAREAFIFPVGLGLAPNGDILVGNTAGVSRIDSVGVIHAVNAIHNYGFSGDGGPAISALTNEPWDLNTDSAGNIFIADTTNNRIRRVDARTGIIETVAGSGPVNGFEVYGTGSYCGDGGPATSACINTPFGIAVAPDGTLYIGENGQRIRKVTPDGTITTFFSGGGQRLRLSSSGNLFMTPNRIQPNGHVFRFTFTGQPQSGIGDGGPASKASPGGGLLNSGIAIDGDGNLFFADEMHGRVRAIRYGAVMAEAGSTVSAGGGSPQMATTGSAFPSAFQISLKSPAGTPENGIRVDFAAPTSGASCAFPDGKTTYSTLTDTYGYASAICTANSQVGAYSVTATPLALGQSVSFSLANKLSGADCFFNWAESTFPQLFAPAGTTSATYTPYYFRYYTGTTNALAASSADNHIWVLGHDTGNTLLDIGPISTYLTRAGCSP